MPPIQFYGATLKLPIPYSCCLGTYNLIVNDANGCGWTRQLDIEQSNDLCYTPHVWVPNIFSPNGDGNNDVAYVRGEGVSYLTFTIYDRWGEKDFRK